MAVAVIAILGSASAASAASFDLGGDWSDTSNPNGAWTLREGSNPLTTSQAGWAGFAASEEAWAPGVNSNPFLPGWFKSDADGSAATHCNNANCNWLANDVVVHTTDPANGTGQGEANVIWTNTSGGTVLADIDGTVWDARSLDRPQQWFLYLNGSTLLDSGTLDDPGDNRASPDIFGAVQLVGAGEYVELRVTRNGTPSGDFVGVTFLVETSAVPEPAMLVFLASGLAGVGLVGRRLRVWA
jgi:hypothetical protein